MANTVIDTFFEEHQALTLFLMEKKEPSYLSRVQDTFRRSFVLAIASYFEHEMCELLREFAKRKSNNNEAVCSLIESKAISRQYHTLFDWEKKNANKFYSWFGETFSQRVRELVMADEALSDAARAFLVIGATRNILVHSNFIQYPIEQTPMELFDLYRSASRFISFIRAELVEN